ncbi:MAG: GGDEF domain-containing protein [Candidatus Eisenbacteria bacterium]|nr:GGDEF domain-containing protein [Candidatus Eisenbacteria bacterium]
MSRLGISYTELLRYHLPSEILTAQERREIDAALAAGQPAEIAAVAQRVLAALIGRGALEVRERIPSPRGPILRLLEPRSRLHLRVLFPPVEGRESPESIPLPLDPRPSLQLDPGLVEQLLRAGSALVLPDRVSTPREVIQELEGQMRAALGVDRVTLRGIDHPPGEFWRTAASAPLGLPEERLRELARARDHVLHVRDFAALDPRLEPAADSGSALYVGIGDDAGGWRAVIEARDRRTGVFDRVQVALALLLAEHFQMMLASAVRLQSLIFFDFLTGLYNRPYFEDQMEKQVAIAQRRKQTLALCIIDIDGFKNFNTLYGYEGGDRVLATVACILKAALRTSDTLARYGGEEFVALLAPPVAPEEARAIAERLRQAVEAEPFQVQSLNGEFLPEKITVSVEGAIHPDHGFTTRELWTAANRMLLEAKAQGKNCVRFVGDPPSPQEPPRA